MVASSVLEGLSSTLQARMSENGYALRRAGRHR